MLRKLLIIILILGLLLPTVTGTAVAQDEYPDQCNYAEEVSTGTYSGELSPTDVDTFILQRQEGGSVYLELEVNGNKISVTALNQRVVNALFNSGTMQEFAQEVNRPDTGYDPHHLHHLDYSITGGFSMYENNNQVAYNPMGDTDRVRGVLAFDVDNYLVDNTWSPPPLKGPIYISEPGKTTGELFFETNDALCLRVQTTSQQQEASWELTIREEKPTSTQTQSPNTEQNQQSKIDNQGESTEQSVQDSDGDGVIDSEDYAPQDPEVQDKSDIQDSSGGIVPGFGVGVAVIALLVGTIVFTRRV
jgi:PGF-CTERM protein